MDHVWLILAVLGAISGFLYGYLPLFAPTTLVAPMCRCEGNIREALKAIQAMWDTKEWVLLVPQVGGGGHLPLLNSGMAK